MAFEKLANIVDQLDTSAKVASLIELSHFPDADVIGLSQRVYQGKHDTDYKSANMQRTARQFLQGGLAQRERLERSSQEDPWWAYNVADSEFAHNAVRIANQMALVCGGLGIATDELFMRSRGNYSTEGSLLRRPIQLATFYGMDVKDVHKNLKTDIWEQDEFEPVSMKDISKRLGLHRSATNNFMYNFVKDGFVVKEKGNWYFPTPKTVTLIGDLFVPIAVQAERSKGTIPQIEQSMVELEDNDTRHEYFARILAPHLARNKMHIKFLEEKYKRED